MDAPNTALEIKAAITAAIAFGTALFGWVGWIVIIWIASMVLDYLTGTWAALKDGEWSSKAARQGLWHKLGSIAAVLVAAMCDIALSVISQNLSSIINYEWHCIIMPVVAVWYTFTELGSIIENAAKLGAPIPKFLVNLIAKVKEATEKSADSLNNEKK